MSKIKVLFTLPSFHTEANNMEVLALVEGLDKAIYEPWLAVEKGGGDFFDKVIKMGYPIMVEPFTIRSNGLVDAYIKSKKMSLEFKKHGFDIWNSFSESSDFSEALIAKAAGAKYVYVKKNMNWGHRSWRIKSFLSKAIVARNKTMFENYFATKKLRKKTFLIKAPQINEINALKEVDVEESNKQTPELEVAAFADLYSKMLKS
ncbi:MAG: hypothetical protein R2800_10735 [Flavipsychrobacter sp.]